MNQDRIFHKARAFFLAESFTATVAVFAILNGLVFAKTKSGLIMTGVRLQN